MLRQVTKELSIGVPSGGPSSLPWAVNVTCHITRHKKKVVILHQVAVEKHCLVLNAHFDRTRRSKQVGHALRDL